MMPQNKLYQIQMYSLPGQLRPILSQNYFGTILRYYFLAGAEIVPRNGFCDRKKKICSSSIFLLRSSRVQSHVITIHIDNRVVAEGKGNSKGNKGKGSKSEESQGKGGQGGQGNKGDEGNEGNKGNKGNKGNEGNKGKGGQGGKGKRDRARARTRVTTTRATSAAAATMATAMTWTTAAAGRTSWQGR